MVGEAKGTHGAILIFCQLLIYILFAYRCFLAKTEHDFGSTFHIKHLLALQCYRLYYGCHILAFCREWYLRNSLYTLTYRAIIYTLIVQPKKKSSFRRVTKNLRFALVREINGSSRVYGNTLINNLLRRIAIYFHLIHAHQILRQRSRLIGTDNSSCSHSLTGMHLAHEVIGLEHTAHTVSQAQSDSHWQSLRHSHNHKCYGNHQCLKYVCYERSDLLH